MNSIQYMAAACDVKRWHCINVAREQTLAEHQWMVTMLTIRIIRKSRYDFDILGTRFIFDCLTHDMEEVDGGDTPNFDEPEWIGEKINDLLTKADWGKLAMKLADLIDAAWFASQNAVGSRAKRQAKIARKRFKCALQAIPDHPLAAASLRDAARSVWKDLNA